jgi:hypothetical protein
MVSKFTATDPMTAERPLVEEAIQQWRGLSKERLKTEHEAAAIKERETALKLWLVDVFKGQKFEGMLIDGRITGCTSREVHTVTDRIALIDYIYDNRALDILQFRITDDAIFTREEEGEVIPGVEKMEVYGLFDRKA